MPAAVAKGIILSLTIIAAVGVAVMESPQVQEWIEQQRRKIAEMLRQLGDDIDPQARQAAETFAFEEQAVTDEDGMRREASGSKEAAEVATGRSLSNAGAVRRIPTGGPIDPSEAEARRMKGREYLAMRNQHMYELQQRRKAAAQEDGATRPSTQTFDQLVDTEGKLRNASILEKELPSPPTGGPLPEPVKVEMKEVEHYPSPPIMMGDSSSICSTNWQTGPPSANPFGDEYALERSITPKPPVPPKIELDREPTPPISVPGQFELPGTQLVNEPVNYSELSYEEQIAIALSLSEQESSTNSATVRQSHAGKDDDDMEAAIAASLKDMELQQAAHAILHGEAATPRVRAVDAQPLVDFTPSEPQAVKAVGRDWAAFLGSPYSASHEPFNLAQPAAASSETSDELYSLTPELTRARLATHNAEHIQTQLPPASSVGSSVLSDSVSGAANTGPQKDADTVDANFHSALSISPPRPSSITLESETQQLIDVSEEAVPEGTRSPISHVPSSFQTDPDSDTEAFASVIRSPPRPLSPARSEVSNVEVIDLSEDSEVDMLSEEGDGIVTPDSWSEVGSRDADNESEDDS